MSYAQGRENSTILAIEMGMVDRGAGDLRSDISASEMCVGMVDREGRSTRES